MERFKKLSFFILLLTSLFITGKMLIAEIMMDSKLNPFEPSYLRSEAKEFISKREYAKAFEKLEESEKLNPKNLTTLRNNLPLYFQIAEEAPEYSPQVKSHFNFLKEPYPNDLGIYIEVFENEKNLGYIDECKDTYQKIRKMRPDIVEWYPSLLNSSVCL